METAGGKAEAGRVSPPPGAAAAPAAAADSGGSKSPGSPTPAKPAWGKVPARKAQEAPSPGTWPTLGDSKQGVPPGRKHRPEAQPAPVAVAASLAPGGAAAAAAAASGTEAAGATSGTSPRGPRGSARGGAEGSGGGAGGTGSGGAGRGEGGGRPRRGRQGREGSRGENARGRGGGRNGRGARGLGDSAGGRSAGAMAGSLPPGVAPARPLGAGGVPGLPGGGRGLPAGVPLGIPPGNAQAASQVMAAAAAAGYYVPPMYYAAPFGALLTGGAPATAAAAGVPAPAAMGGVGTAVAPSAEGSTAAPERVDPLQAFRLQVLAAAKTQAEYYFSVQNLCRDMFLRKQMDDQGWISVQVILGFNRVRQILSSLPEPPLAVLCAALEGSELVEFSPGGQEVRARGSWSQWVMPKDQRTPRTADGGDGGEVQPNGQRALPNGPGPSAKAGAREQPATSPTAGDEASRKSSEKVRGEEGGAPNGVAVQAN